MRDVPRDAGADHARHDQPGREAVGVVAGDLGLLLDVPRREPRADEHAQADHDAERAQLDGADRDLRERLVRDEGKHLGPPA